MKKLKALFQKTLKSKRKIISLFALLAIIVTVGIFVKAATLGNGINQLGSRLPNRLDLHSGQVAQNAPAIRLYLDQACRVPNGKHKLFGGDWTVLYSSGAVTYPITAPQDGGSDYGYIYTTHYINPSDQRYIATRPGNFSGTGWNTDWWYNNLPTSIGYTSQIPGNGDSVWVGNNTGNFAVTNLNSSGYAQLWSGDWSSEIMSANWSQYCFYDSSHSDLVNADYSWNRAFQPWNTNGLNQGKNTVWFAGMDASGNFATGSRNIKWDTLGPILSASKNVKSQSGSTVYGLQNFIKEYGHNGWLNSANKRAGEYYNISGRDDNSQTNDISGVNTASFHMAIDNPNAYGGYQRSTGISSALDTTYYSEPITSLMNRTGDGSHTVYYSMLDLPGNNGTGSQKIKVDTVYPNITAQPAKGQFNSTKDGIALNLSFSDPGSNNGTGSGIDTSTEQYQWVQKGNAPLNNAWKSYTGGTVTQTQKGEWTLWVKVSDIAGNIKQNPFGTYYCGSLTGEIVNPVEAYSADEDVIASVLVHSNDSGDITPGNNASVTFNVKDSSGAVITNQTKFLVVPDNQTQLIWFRFHTPKSSGKLTLTATINSSLADAQHNPFSITHDVLYSISPNFTDMGGDFNMPGWFEKGKEAPTANRSSANWQEWSYNGAFTLNTYTAAVSSTLKITADPDDHTYTTDFTGHITQKSGYGFMEKPSTTVINSYPDSNAVTKVQFAYALYPEWNYQSDYARVFGQTGISSVPGNVQQSFNLPINPDFTNGTFNDSDLALIKEKHVHFTPVAFPDGTYTAQITACDVWTPAGVLDSTATGSITIKDGLYNDWTYEETTAEAIQRKH